MRWSLKLGRWLGIDVYLHFTFVLVLGFLGLSHWLVSRNAVLALEGVGFFLVLFGCVLLHEYGHALMARRYGIQTKDITLLPIGGVARLERMPEEPIKEFWIAVAGPAVNVIIALALAAGLWLSNAWQPIEKLSVTGGHFAERLLAVNVFLVLFNLLPAFPMDGGRVVRALLAMRLGFGKATQIAAALGQGMAFLFGFIGLFTNPMLLLIALFVWIGAAQEATMAQMRSSLAGISVERAMLTDFRSLTPTDSLGRAVTLVLAGSQADFPVVEGGEIVGILTRQDLIAGLAEHGPTGSVAQVMKREFPSVEPGALLEAILANGRTLEAPVVPVTDRGRLVGLLTMDNVSEFVMIRNALASREAAAG